MIPLSRRKRYGYLALFAVLFVLSVPTALLYARGFRYVPGFGVVQTGGIVLNIPYTEALVSLNGREIDRTSILNRSIYIDELAPSSYIVHVSREGANPWYRTLVVEPQLVTDARVHLVPQDIEPVRLVRGGSSATSTKGISAETYDAYRNAFKTPATTTDPRARDGVLAFVRDGDAYVHWRDAGKLPPGNFCGRPSYCVDEFAVEGGRQGAVSVSLWDEGLVYTTRQGGVFFSEVDIRPTPVVVPLYPRAGADARVVDGTLIVKDGEELYEIRF